MNINPNDVTLPAELIDPVTYASPTLLLSEGQWCRTTESGVPAITCVAGGQLISYVHIGGALTAQIADKPVPTDEERWQDLYSRHSEQRRAAQLTTTSPYILTQRLGLSEDLNVTPPIISDGPYRPRINHWSGKQ